MHTEHPERAIPRAYQKNEKKNNKKKHTKNPKRAISRSYKKNSNTSSNKPDVKKRKRYVDDMNDFASRLFKEFGSKIRPPVSVVAEVVKTS